MNELSVQSSMKQCENAIEQTTLCYVEFWSQLQEDHPDLGKLSELGYKINISTQTVEDNWLKLQRQGVYIPSIMRLYGYFLIEILNDNDEGTAVLNKIGSNVAKDFFEKQAFMLDLGANSKPSIVISAEDDSYGQIINANLAATGLLGYQKIEILGKKVNLIMPRLYSDHHDRFLDNYLATLEPKILNMEKLLPSKTKQGYMVQISTIVRHIPSLIHGLQFVAQFKVQKTLTHTGSMLVNLDGTVEIISQQLINMLYIEQSRVDQIEPKVTQIIPDFFDKLDEYITSKNGQNGYIKQLGKNKRVLTANIIVQKLIFRGIGHCGYKVQIERLQNKSNFHQMFELTNREKLDEKNIEKHIEFYFDVSKLSYLGVMTLGTTKNKSIQLGDIDIINRTQQQHSRLDLTAFQNQEETVQVDQYNKVGEFQRNPYIINNTYGNMDQMNLEDDHLLLNIPNVGEQSKTEDGKTDWGKNIRTVRWVVDKIIDIEEIKREEEEVEAELNQDQRDIQDEIQTLKQNFDKSSGHDDGNDISNI